MSWENVFFYIDNIIRIITLIGPIIEFVEKIFNKIFPGEGKGDQKKEIVMMIARKMLPPDVPEEVVSLAIDQVVDQLNKSGEFYHHKDLVEIQLGGP